MITVSVPRAWLLNANSRLHWREKARRTAALRDVAALHVPAGAGPLQGRQRCVVTVEWPNRRRRDVANIHPTVKACIDGLVSDAGLLPDDSDQFLVGPDLRVSDQLCDKRYAAVLHITFKAVS